MKKMLLAIVLLTLLLIAAKPVKMAFFDVEGPIDTIEFSGKKDYSQCVYWEADEYSDYAVYLGWFGAEEFAPDPLAFCLENAEHMEP